MNKAVIYDQTGKILRIVSGPAEALFIQHNTALGENYLIGEADGNSYIVADEITTRPTQSTSIDKTTLLANGVDAATLSNLPIGGTITVTHSSGVSASSEILDTTETILTSMAGIMRITVEKWPYLDYQVTINAN